MKTVIRNAGNLPSHLLAMLVGFALVPLWSLSFLPPPWEIASTYEPARAALVLFAYWLGPLTIVVTLSLRSALLIGVFGLECLAIIAFSILDASSVGPVQQTLRFVMLGAMAIVGALMATRDTLYPLLHKHARGFRRATRLPVTGRALLRHIDESYASRVKVMVENVSLTGCAIGGAREYVEDVLGGRGKGDSVLIDFLHADGIASVRATIVWIRAREPMLQVGLTTADETAMSTYIESLGRREDERGAVELVSRLWAVTSLRRSALALWLVCLGGAYGMPACGQLEEVESKRSQGSASAVAAEFVNVAVEVQSESYGLASTELTLTAGITGCASGYVDHFDTEDAEVPRVPLGDVGCRAVVDALYVGELEYLPVDGASFESGSIVDFVNAGGGMLKLLVNENLADPIADGQKIDLRVLSLEAGEVIEIEATLPEEEQGEACSITVLDPGVAKKRATQYEVKVKPTMLTALRSLQFKPCAEKKSCPPEVRSGSSVQQINEFQFLYDKAGKQDVSVSLRYPSKRVRCVLKGVQIP